MKTYYDKYHVDFTLPNSNHTMQIRKMKIAGIAPAQTAQ